MDESRDVLLERSESFGRTHSWCLQVDQLNPPEAFKCEEVNTLAEWALPLEYLQPEDARGDASAIGELHQFIDAMLTGSLCDPFFSTALKAAQQKVFGTWQMLLHSHIEVGRLPLHTLHAYLQGVQELSMRVKRGHQDSTDIADAALVTEEELKSGIAELERLSMEPRFREELLPDADDTRESFKQGWKDDWWRSGRRQRALEILDAQNRQWGMDDERERLAVDNRELLLGQFSGVKARLEIADELRQLSDVIPQEVTDRQVSDFETIEQQYRHYRELALQDVQVVEHLLGNLIMQDADATKEYQKTTDYITTFLPDNEQRLSEISTEVKRLEDWYEDERRYRMYTQEGLKFNSTAVMLQKEVDRLRKMLREKEEELQREADLWAKRQQEAGYLGLDTITEDLDERYEARHAKLLSIKTLLELERHNCEERAAEFRQAEDHRRAEVQELLKRLEERRATLQSTARSFQEFADTSKMAHELLLELRSVVADYIEQQQENGRTWIPALLVEALKIGARMDELLRRVDAEKCARISSVDTTMRHLTMLLEFSVDTYDPNAHKFQAILNALVLTREGLQEAMHDNAMLHEWLKAEVAACYRQLALCAPRGESRPASASDMLPDLAGRPSSASAKKALPETFQLSDLLEHAKTAYPVFFTALDEDPAKLARLPSANFTQPPASRYVLPSPRSHTAASPTQRPGDPGFDAINSPVLPFPTAMSWSARGPSALPPLDAPAARPRPAEASPLGGSALSLKSYSSPRLQHLMSLRKPVNPVPLGQEELAPVSFSHFDHREFSVHKPFN